MKRAALYLRVSTVDQHPETQRHDLLHARSAARLRDRPRIHRPPQRRQSHAVPGSTNSWPMLVGASSM